MAIRVCALVALSRERSANDDAASECDTLVLSARFQQRETINDPGLLVMAVALVWRVIPAHLDATVLSTQVWHEDVRLEVALGR